MLEKAPKVEVGIKEALEEAIDENEKVFFWKILVYWFLVKKSRDWNGVFAIICWGWNGKERFGHNGTCEQNWNIRKAIIGSETLLRWLIEFAMNLNLKNLMIFYLLTTVPYVTIIQFAIKNLTINLLPMYRPNKKIVLGFQTLNNSTSFMHSDDTSYPTLD